MTLAETRTGLSRGFEQWDEDDIWRRRRRANEVSDRATARLSASCRRPFLLFLNYFDAHALPTAALAGAGLPRRSACARGADRDALRRLTTPDSLRRRTSGA
jgi:hypothetical protein